MKQEITDNENRKRGENMPAYYAHDRFGRTVLKQLKGNLRETILQHRGQYDIGLQGPDLFFFYKPYTKNRVVRYGNDLHKISAYPFFEHALSVVNKRGEYSGEYAYLLGFICHFALDSQCHPYVRHMMEKTGVAHLEIEEEFEKKLLRMDGQDPFSFPMADLVPQDPETAEAIVPFYRGIDLKTVQKSLQDLKRVKKLFTAPGSLKYGLINGGMRLTFRYGEVKGLMHQRRDNPRCISSNRGLQKRFDEAVEVAVHLIQDFEESLRTGKALDERFDRTFE